MSKNKPSQHDNGTVSRRRFIAGTAQAACAVSLLGLGLSWVGSKSSPRKPRFCAHPAHCRKMNFWRPVCAAVSVSEIAHTMC